MSNPDVRHVGTVTDVHGRPLKVGVDHDTVTIGDYELGREARDEFLRHFFDADTAAYVWAAASDEDTIGAGDGE